MSDKSPSTIAVTASYVTGESPNATKLSVTGQQVASATRKIESYIGDPRGESAPYAAGTDYTNLVDPQPKNITTGASLANAKERTLDIVNLARLIGPASMLNPRSLENRLITEAVPAGVYEFALGWPVDESSTGTDPRFLTEADYADSDIVFVDGDSILYREGLNNMLYAGFTIDVLKGVLYTYAPTTGGTITYPVDLEKILGGFNYLGARFNVIPDPNQLQIGNTNVLNIGALTAGRHTITLPIVTRQQSNEDITSITLSEADVNYHQQLKLPAALDDLAPGSVIPEGFLLLKNIVTNKVYTEATYYWNSSTEFETSGIDLTSVNPNQLVLITVGTDITTSIDDLRIKSRHAHDRKYGEPLVNLKDISGFRAYSGQWGSFYKEEDVASNFAPQYLHRDAYSFQGDIKQTISGFLVTKQTDVTPEDVDDITQLHSPSTSYVPHRGAPGILLGSLDVGLYRRMLRPYTLGDPGRDIIAIKGPKGDNEDRNWFKGICISQFGQSHLAHGEASVYDLDHTGDSELHDMDEPLRLAFISQSLSLGDAANIASISIVDELGISGDRIVSITGMFKGSAGGLAFMNNWASIGGETHTSIGGTIPGSTGVWDPALGTYSIIFMNPVTAVKVKLMVWYTQEESS